jgi:hypothetical protein
MLRTWNQSKIRGRAAPSRPGRLRCRPSVELLEDRTLLSFNAPLTYPTDQSPQQVVTADFNRDGVLDLAVTNNGFSDGSFSGLSILLGNGDGTFQRARTMDVGPNPFALAVGDFNGDGIPDLAVTHAGDWSSGLDTVSILLGNGDGTFRTAAVYTVGMNPRGIAAGDFRGDGRLDLVTADTGNNAVSVLRGIGDGTFQAAVSLPVGANPVSVAVGDFNGHLGIVTADEGDAQGNGGGVSVLLGNGDGTFQAAVTYGLGQAGSRPAARAVAVADLNGDGISDLATANDSDDGSTASVLLGRGDGTFQGAVAFPVAPVSGQALVSNALSVAAGDFNGDGRQDLIVSNAALLQGGRGDLSQLFLLAGNGDGTFGAPVGFDSGALPISVAAADFNGDGTLDVAVANDIGGDVSILLGRGDGSFNIAPTFPAGAGAFSLAQGDFNGDGVPDLVTANFNDDSISVLLGNGDGTFKAPVNYPVGHLPDFLAVADHTPNGIEDIVVANEGTQARGTLSVLLGRGDGTFQPARTIDPGLGVFIPISLVVANFTGDRTPEVAISYEAGGGAAGILVLAANGHGTFRQLANLVFGTLSNPGRLAVADVNGDGTADLLLPVDAPNGGGVDVLLGDGHGGFRDLGLTQTGVVASAVAAGDFNADGIPDLAVTNFLSNTVSVLLGNGNGTFHTPLNYTVGANPRSVAVADLQGNGILDIVTASSTGNTVSVLLGNGDGSFQPETRYLTDPGTDAVVAGDFNGDGALDLATANTISGDVSVLLNRNDGTQAGGGAAAKHQRPSLSSRGPSRGLAELIPAVPPPADLPASAGVAPPVLGLRPSDHLFAGAAVKDGDVSLARPLPARLTASRLRPRDPLPQGSELDELLLPLLPPPPRLPGWSAGS